MPRGGKVYGGKRRYSWLLFGLTFDSLGLGVIIGETAFLVCSFLELLSGDVY